ncbi:hypothetical protein DSO57_1024210 [Entomophthora muscae]|uniref:Uncharacterized protein n=1 Tax=Entomophthora muscae TaxID=34485 RepID=A0ACC2T356_9FUNG|nr:hypothetical protein DSO57_1024210 [Entomophthora muscae]
MTISLGEQPPCLKRQRLGHSIIVVVLKQLRSVVSNATLKSTQVSTGGKARKVSQQQTCLTRLCVFSSSSQDVISYETSPSMGWTAAFLFELIGPSHPTPLKIASRFNSSENYSMVSKGPVKGHVWFKPLFWAVSGWYSKSTARENDSSVQSFQLEVRFPLAFIDVAEGAFSFVPSTKEN